MTMVKSASAISGVVLILFVATAVGQQAGTSCSKLTAVTECYPRFQQYAQLGINLTRVFQMVAAGAQNITTSCRRFTNLTACVEAKLKGCTSESDPANAAVLFWDRTADGIQHVCVDKRQEFIGAQTCLSNGDIIKAVTACDTPDESEAGGRHTRHTCGEYEKEVTCSDAVVTKQCGADVGQLVGKITRSLLRSTPHTKDCKEPGFTSGSARPTTAMLTSITFLMTSLCIML